MFGLKMQQQCIVTLYLNIHIEFLEYKARALLFRTTDVRQQGIYLCCRKRRRNERMDKGFRGGAKEEPGPEYRSV